MSDEIRDSKLAGSNIGKEPIRVRKADLVDAGGHKSECPQCGKGLLLMRREFDGNLLDRDVCCFCGQQFIYTDLEEWKKENYGKE